LIAATALALLAALAGDRPEHAEGLSCAPVSDKELYRNADVIFDGVALSGPASPIELVSPARFKVIRYLKGRGPDIVRVETAMANPWEDHTLISGMPWFATGDAWRIYGNVPDEAGNSARLGVRSDRGCGGSGWFQSGAFLTDGPGAAAAARTGVRWKAMLHGAPGSLRCLHLWIPRQGTEVECKLLNPGTVLIASALSKRDGEESTAVAVAGLGLVSFTVEGPLGTQVVDAAKNGGVGIATFPGYVDPDATTTLARFADGTERLVDSAARRTTAELPPTDRLSASAFEAVAEPAYPPEPGVTCVRAGPTPSGLQNLDARFRSLRATWGECGNLDQAPVFSALRYVGNPDTGDAESTTIFGAAGPSVASVAVDGPDGRRPLPLSRQGRSFITAYAGEAAQSDLTLRIELADGTTLIYDGAESNLLPRREPWSPGD
jgi:hypothetical protein